MKKINVYLLLFMMMFMLSACNDKSEDMENDLEVNEIRDEEIKTGDTTENMSEEYLNVVELNTYSTKFGEYTGTSYPVYSFDYPDNWSITVEDCNASEEFVTLSNERGVEIVFSHWDAPESETFQYGGVGWTNVTITNVAESAFEAGIVYGKDYSYIGEFMVAEITRTSMMDGLTGETMPAEGTFFAILPKTEQGETYYKSVLEAVFSFWHGNHISFVCTSPDWSFTEEEKQEVIDIMSSFRVETKNDVANVSLDNTYRTKWMDEFGPTYPYFEFDYPDNWSVTSEIYEDMSEYITLTNKNGVEIKFSHGDVVSSDVSNTHLVKVYESQFIPNSVQGTDHSHLGEFAVVKVVEEDGSVIYGVVPAFYIGEAGVMTGEYQCAYSFPYSGDISLICDTSGVELTEQELNEVIAILSTFREVGYR
ncbi:MAG: hypothetical protein J6J16_01485 [Lachnospiraceae bacterium]|nr:hypothetical protein [Lachnospiraceae bacterium]